MFKTLRLTNFRRHTNLTIHFQNGLVAIRGLNEAGKTTVQEALAYALFGAKALRQTFDEVVTWGQPERTLQVELELDTGTKIRRGKSGAEITYNAQVVCTGQGECTRYFETLLGTTADTASKLMLASQGKLRGALEGGASEAALLIEGLADFDLVDRVVNLIQHELPTGNTAAAEANVQMLDAQLAEIVVEPLDTAADEARIDALNARLGAAYEEQKTLSSDLQAIDVIGARRFMADLAAAERDLAALDPVIAQAESAAAREVAEPTANREQIEEWRRAIMDLKDESARRTAYSMLKRIPEPDPVWDGSPDSFRAELAALTARREEATADIADLLATRSSAVAQLITEKACAFCGKDLTDVPEVTRRNIEADAVIVEMDRRLAAAKAELEVIDAARAEMHAVDQAAHAYETAIARYSAYVVQYPTRYPCLWAWIGEVPSVAGDHPDYNALIRGAEMALSLYQRECGAVEQAKNQVVVLKAQHLSLSSRIETMQQQQPAMAERIKQGEGLERAVADRGRELGEIKASLTQMCQQFEHLKQIHARAEQQRSMVKAQLAKAVALLHEMSANNALVKKVRAARPVISDKLWSIVLSSVSHQFSEIRGTKSVITRSDNGFRCDGQAVPGLSGSTLDALGLAIRIALTKTFLPNSRFMMLDEPGAACDDEREANMLGLVAASDFDQVLLVTHSALADSFASQVVQL